MCHIYFNKIINKSKTKRQGEVGVEFGGRVVAIQITEE